MVLNLHGEVPSDPTSVRYSAALCLNFQPNTSSSKNTCVLNAEIKFLPHLQSLHARFPKLRIVLEHATTRAAVEAVKSLGETVGCTITAHHLALTVDDWAGQGFHYCKPVAKFPDDRLALREVVREGNLSRHINGVPNFISLGHPRFFLGSDSAPHPLETKSTSTPSTGCAAGVFTSSHLLPLTAHLLEEFGALDKLEGFVSTNGRRFYGREVAAGTGTKVRLQREPHRRFWRVSLGRGELSIVPFMGGGSIYWRLVSS